MLIIVVIVLLINILWIFCLTILNKRLDGELQEVKQDNKKLKNKLRKEEK